MSGNAELNNVWVQLYIGDDPKGNAFELEAQRNVGALAKKVWGERETRLQESSGARDASELNVYPSGTAVPIPNGTKSVDPGEEVPAAPTSKKPLIVIAPKPEQQDVSEQQSGIQLRDGTFWTPLEELYKPSSAPFENGYKAICLRMVDKEWNRPQDYQYIVDDLKNQAIKSTNVDDISLHSASTNISGRSAVSAERKTGSKAPKSKNLVKITKPKESFDRGGRDCLGGDLGNKGHLIPAPKTLCAPRYGIITQPIIGFSFEDFVKSKIEEEGTKDSAEWHKTLIRILQKSVISDRTPHGIASRNENFLYVPKSGHEEHFDNDCQWFFIPVLTLEDALIKWTSGKEYKVMVIAGDLREQGGAGFSAKLHRLLMPHNVLQDEESQCLLDEKEIRMATAFLEAFVKALADVATGRAEAGKLTPDALDREDKDYRGSPWQKKLQELEEGRKSLEEGNEVMIPELKVRDFSKVNVLGLTLKNGPDPALLGIKDAIGWMTQNGQRPLPACETSSEAADDDDSGSTGEDSFQGITSTPNVPKFVCVTPSPTRDRTPSRLSLLREDSFGSLSE